MITNQKRQPAFTDLDPMPFGIHKGKPLQDVPSSYLKYLWDDGIRELSINYTIDCNGPLINKIKLANYIWNSQDDILK